MKKQYLFVLAYFSLIFSSSLIYSNTSLQDSENYAFKLDAYEFRAFPIKTNITHQTLEFSIACENCTINIMILNETNFNIFNAGGLYSMIFSETNISHSEGLVQLTRNEVFYFITQNPTKFKSPDISLYYEIQLRISNPLIKYFVGFLLLGSNLLLIFLIIYRNHRRRSK